MELDVHVIMSSGVNFHTKHTLVCCLITNPTTRCDQERLDNLLQLNRSHQIGLKLRSHLRPSFSRVLSYIHIPTEMMSISRTCFYSTVRLLLILFLLN